jgi:hypothetical protein
LAYEAEPGTQRSAKADENPAEEENVPLEENKKVDEIVTSEKPPENLTDEAESA